MQPVEKRAQKDTLQKMKPCCRPSGMVQFWIFKQELKFEVTFNIAQGSETQMKWDTILKTGAMLPWNLFSFFTF